MKCLGMLDANTIYNKAIWKPRLINLIFDVMEKKHQNNNLRYKLFHTLNNYFKKKTLLSNCTRLKKIRFSKYKPCLMPLQNI